MKRTRTVLARHVRVGDVIVGDVSPAGRLYPLRYDERSPVDADHLHMVVSVDSWKGSAEMTWDLVSLHLLGDLEAIQFIESEVEVIRE